MSLNSSSSYHQPYEAEIDALKKLFLYESDNDKIHLSSFLHNLNVKIDSSESNYQNFKSSSRSSNNYNNSYVPNKKDNLSALYKYYQIDTQLYPPPDLQLYKIVQSSRLENYSLFERHKYNCNNSTRRSRRQKKKQKKLKIRKKNKNKQSETDNFHYRNMITVRRISCHDMFDRQMMMKKQKKFKNQKKKYEWNKTTRTNNLLENKLQKAKIFSTEFKSRSNRSPDSLSTMNSNTNVLTSSVSNTSAQQQKSNKKMSDSMSMTGLKVNSLHNMSTSSLRSIQLLSPTYNPTKPYATITTSTPPGSQIKFKSSKNSSPHLSSTTTIPSIVPHFSSTIAPRIPYHMSSSTIKTPNVSKVESTVISPSKNDNIQDLIDQLKTCIAMLSELFQDKTKQEKLLNSNTKSSSNKKSRRKNKQLSPSSSSSSSSRSLISTPDHLTFSKKSINNENNLVFEDITVRRCTSFNDQNRKRTINPYKLNYQKNTPISYNDQLKRCLLIYHHHDRNRNLNSNEKYINSHSTFNDYL